MDYLATIDLLEAQIIGLGVAFLTVLTGIISISLGLLVFRWGSKKIANLAGESNFIGSESEYPKAARDRMIAAMDRSNRSQNKSFDY